MTNRILLVVFSFSGWLTLAAIVAESHIAYALVMMASGIAISGWTLKNILVNQLALIERKVNVASTEAKGLDNAFASLTTSVHQLQKKIEISIEGINKLGRQEELKELDPVLRGDGLGNALSNASQMIARIKAEEAERQWVTEGLARFARLLANKTELKEYGNSIISALVKYVDANQGGLFLEKKNSEGKRQMELVACYAYERRKYLEGAIEAGQGLLGQCMLEKDFVFITDVPTDYVRITSGLGYATPRNIVIAPLIDRDIFYGAIELGLFNVMKPHQIEFLKKVCENIASEIASMRNLEETKQLLGESHLLTNELQSREEEMRQNMEELAATQEEMARKQAEIDSYLAAINVTIASAEFSRRGLFIRANDIFLKVLGYQSEELKNKSYLELMPEVDAVQMMWENLSIGKFFSGEFKMRDKKGNETWLTGTFNPVMGTDGKITKVMMLAQFVTQEKEHLNELTEMANLLKTTLPLAEFSEQLVCKTANDRFMKMFGVSRLQLKGKSMFDFIDDGALGSAAMKDALAKGCLTTTLPFKVNHQLVNFEVSISRSVSLDGRMTKFTLVLIKESDQKISVLAAV